MTATPITARCHCGNAEIPLELPTSSLPLPLHLCHCDSSRHVSGTIFTGYITLPSTPDALENVLERSDSLHLTSYLSSDDFQRFFCSNCGTHMVAYRKSAAKWSVAMGTIDRTEGIIFIKDHMWVGDTKDGGAADWIPKLGGRTMKRYQERPGTEELTRGWMAAASTALDESSSTGEDRLQGRCHCGGVQYYITRPNEGSKDAHAPYPDLMAPHDQPDDNPEHESWWLSSDRKRYAAGTCACNSCRLATGFPIQTWLFTPLNNIFQPDGSPLDFAQGTLRTYESSEGVKRYFCGTCGATAFWYGHDRTGLIDVGVGLLRAAEGARAGDWLDWWTGRVSFEGDAVDRELVEELQRGIQEWGREH